MPTNAVAVLLDVDGVLNPVVVNGQLTLTRDRAALVRELHEHVHLVWASTWSRDHTIRLAEHIGLPAAVPAIAFPVHPATTPADGWCVEKLSPVERWCRRGHPGVDPAPHGIVWIDDDLGDDAQEWAKSQPRPVLILRPDPLTGLTRQHVHDAIRFSEAPKV